MTDTDTSKNVDDTVNGLQDKSRALNDSLKALSTDGFEKLSRAVGQVSVGSGPLRERTSASSIVDQELRSLLKQEVTIGFRDIFNGNPGQGNTQSGYSVVINNNTSAQVSARENDGGMDQKQLEITIDQMVANSLLSGRQTSGVMRTLFGLAPTLIGR